MSWIRSIRARLMLGATLVLIIFVAGAGAAVQRAHADSVLAGRHAQLQSTVYLLLAAAELDTRGVLVMPPSFPEPRLSLPGSGLYARIAGTPGHKAWKEAWQSPSAVGIDPPFLREVDVGQWRNSVVAAGGQTYLATAYGVNWAVGTQAVPLMFFVLEDKADLDREIAIFDTTLWTWLGGAAVLLLASQTLLLGWGLAPLRRVAGEIRAIESGDQSEVKGRYPAEIELLTSNLNTLIKQERLRQTRYREASSFLAHSLKTPLAVLRTALTEPARLPGVVDQQVAHMDDIIQYQLGRAAASGSSRFVPRLLLLPVVQRIRDSLLKVHADKDLHFVIDCPPDLAWRIDNGDALELFGNLMDNACKWTRQRVAVSVQRQADTLHIRVDDDGPGFGHGEGDAQDMLQIHVRGDEQVPGHGVGLAIVKDLVTSHDGELALADSPLGGARIDIVLRAA
ncbi:MAG: histidine kinase [Burkholderiales bacterium]|nr:histidine kinase [Burkholderiales bacterium]